jgi:lipopolysaccharide assembly outer membrane protein LptD (OstA)
MLTSVTAFSAPVTSIHDSTAVAAPALITAKDTTEIHDTLSPAPQNSNLDTVNYTADVIEYDIAHKVLLLHGNALVEYRGTTIFADTIHYLIDEGTLAASGLPQLIENGDTVVGESMHYNLRNRRGRVRTASAASGDTRYNGDFIAKSDSNSYYLEQGEYTTCTDIDTPHYCFYGRHIKVLPRDKAITRPVVLNIGTAPVFVLPYFILPMDNGRSSGVLRPRFGGNPASGGYMDNIGYYWAPNDYMDYILSLRVSEFEDWLISAGGAYALRYWLNGSISGRYSRNLNFRTANERWSLDYSHQQNLAPDGSFTLSGRGSIVSDKHFYTQFSQDSTELLNQNISANLALSKRLPKINGSINAAWNRNQNLTTGSVDEELPSVSFGLTSRPLIPQRVESEIEAKDPAWYNKIYWSYSARALQKRNYLSNDTLNTPVWAHSGLNQSVSLNSPQTLFKWFTISPNFSIQNSLFDAYYDTTSIITYEQVILRDTTEAPAYGWEISETFLDTTKQNRIVKYVVTKNDSIRHVMRDTTTWRDNSFSFRDAQTSSWQAGVNLSTQLYGLYPIRIFNFAGLRHTLSPSVGYTFVPEKKIDHQYPGIGIPYAGAGKRQQIISFSLGNLFQGKTIAKALKPGDKDTEKKFTILSGSMGTSYNAEAKKRKWSNVGLNASTSYSMFNVGYNSSYTLYNESDALITPVLMSYSVSLRPQSIGARGSFWNGDLISLYGPQTGAAPAALDNWNIGINPSYEFSRSRSRTTDDFISRKNYQLSTSVSLAFTQKWSTSWSGYYNFNTNRLESNTINFHADLECWDLQFDWRPSGYNPGFYFSVAIKKHPDIKWELRD